MSSELKVVVNAGRNIIQSAQSFKTPEAAVWEYVVNSLQYKDPGVASRVEITVDTASKRIVIADNGSGMDRDGLTHFFTMHGENQQRRAGVPGRGKFGTGKSAAFGIGKNLTVSTTRSGLRQTVELTRASIDAAIETNAQAVPVTFLEQDAVTDEPNGTIITISEITVRLAKEPIVALIERHLAAFQGTPVVVVNGRVCEIVRPQASIERTFTPTPEQAALLGDVTLTVKAATAPLDEIHRGVQVTIGDDNLVAVEAAGVDTKEFGKYLFGHIDCPALDDSKYDPVAAYTNDRSMKLNMAHPVVQALIPFIGSGLEQVRQELVEVGKQAKEDADRRRLKETTSKIEDILNADLKDFRERVEGVGNRRQGAPLPAPGTDGLDDSATVVVDPDGEEAGRVDDQGDGEGGKPFPPPGPDPKPFEPIDDADGANGASIDPQGDEKVTPAGNGRPKLRGGLVVDFDHYGADYDRYYWDSEDRKIVINLDHRAIVAAKALPDDEVTFRRLIWEIAFTAYAIALADLQFERDPARDSSDATYEIRDALKRVWSSAASLYAA